MPNRATRKPGVRRHVGMWRPAALGERHHLHMRRASELKVVAAVVVVEAGWFTLFIYLGLRLLG